MSLSTLINQLTQATSQGFESARPIPSGLHHSEAFLSLEREQIFLQEWICVGRADEIEHEGEYLSATIAEVPVFVIRQRAGEIGAFINACAHRFACLLPKSKGKAKRLTCRYHGWTYDTNGRLIAAPYMDMKPGFDKSEHRLQTIHCEVWEGFVYVNLAKAPATNLNQVLQPLTENIVGRYDMSCYQSLIKETMTWNANWKNLVENFTESYHVPIAHGKTFAQHNKPLVDYVCGEDSDYYGYHYAPQEMSTGLGAAHPGNTRLTGSWRRTMVDFCVFPNHLVTLMPDYLWYISVQPQGTDQFTATWGVAFPPEILNDIEPDKLDTWLAEFKHYIDVANDEDKVIVEALHIGTKSPILPQGTYHPIERNLWQFNRYLARMCIDPKRD